MQKECDTVEWYDQNASLFFGRSISADIADMRTRFLSHLVPGSRILDAGCGSGRDARYFKEQGFEVLAFDASAEMVKHSSEFVGQPTLKLRFQDMDFVGEFDAVWASASLLHVPYAELAGVFQKFHRALKESGILFASFKYGKECREDEGRLFYDMNEEMILPYVRPYFTPIDVWTSRWGIRNKDQLWCNILLSLET